MWLQMMHGELNCYRASQMTVDIQYQRFDRGFLTPISYLYFHINFGYEEFLYKLGECYSSNVERSSTVTHTSKYNGRANVDNVPAPVSLLSIFVPDR